MISSVLIYSFSGIILFLLGQHVYNREEQSKIKYGKSLPMYSWEIIVAILYFAILAGFRYQTGFDYAMYLKEYLHLQATGIFGRENFEPGFVLISKFFAATGVHYFFYFAFWGALQIFFIYYGLKDRKFLWPFIGLNIILGPYYLIWMNAMRQSVIVCLFVPLVILIQKRKFWQYLIIVLIASTIHKSGLLLIPLYFIPRINFRIKDRYVFLIILLVCIIIGLRPFWLSIFGNFQELLQLIGYQRYDDLMNPIIGGDYRAISWGSSRIGLLFIDFCFIWYYLDVKEYFKGDKLLPIYFTFAFIGACLENLLMNTDDFVLRPTQYFLIFVLIMNSYTLVYLWRTKRKVMFWVLSFVIFSYIYFEIFKSTYMPDNLNAQVFYRFFFFR
jgi:hypothetical protein